jgi:hypothetical protein
MTDGKRVFIISRWKGGVFQISFMYIVHDCPSTSMMPLVLLMLCCIVCLGRARTGRPDSYKAHAMLAKARVSM